MMRAYHRVDPLMDERKSHYTPAQFGTFTKVQLLAGRQTHRGRFRSLQALTGAMPTAYARLIGFLIEQGDLIVQSDGALYMDGWDEWQEGDLTVGERMKRLRERKRNGDRNATVTPTVTNAVTQPSPAAIGVSSSVGVGVSSLSGATARAPNGEPDRHGLPHITAAVQEAGEAITGQGMLAAGENQLTELDRQVEVHGEAAVVTAMQTASDGKRFGWRKLVWDSLKLLEPFATGKPETPEPPLDPVSEAYMRMSPADRRAADLAFGARQAEKADKADQAEMARLVAEGKA